MKSNGKRKEAELFWQSRAFSVDDDDDDFYKRIKLRMLPQFQPRKRWRRWDQRSSENVQQIIVSTAERMSKDFHENPH